MPREATWTSALVTVLAVVLYVFLPKQDMVPLRPKTATENCVEPPLCFSPRLTWRGRFMCITRAQPLDPSGAAYREYASERLRQLGPQLVKGQYAVGRVIRQVEYKLYHMSEPLVLHFAGDNGVGKTRLAEVVSLSLGMRCGNDACNIGDSTLVLSGTSYDGMTLPEFRRHIVPIIIRHATTYPSNGVIIFNELASLEPSKVRLLLPLLGRDSRFPEFMQVNLARLTVILTTDFGQEGRTRGKSLTEMEEFITMEFQELYSRQSTSLIRVHPFLPLTLETAREIIFMTMRDMNCARRKPPHSSVEISEDAVLWLLEKVKVVLATENGRAVVREVQDSVEPLLRGLEAAAQHEKGAVIDLSADGELEVVV